MSQQKSTSTQNLHRGHHTQNHSFRFRRWSCSPNSDNQIQKNKTGHRRIIHTSGKEKKKEKIGKEVNETEVKKNVTNEEFKVMITKILTRLEKRVEEISENFIKYMENLKKEAEL